MSMQDDNVYVLIEKSDFNLALDQIKQNIVWIGLTFEFSIAMMIYRTRTHLLDNSFT